MILQRAFLRVLEVTWTTFAKEQERFVGWRHQATGTAPAFR